MRRAFAVCGFFNRNGEVHHPRRRRHALHVTGQIARFVGTTAKRELLPVQLNKLSLDRLMLGEPGVLRLDRRAFALVVHFTLELAPFVYQRCRAVGIKTQPSRDPPILIRHETTNVSLSIDDQAGRYRLDPSGAQASGHLLP